MSPYGMKRSTVVWRGKDYEAEEGKNTISAAMIVEMIHTCLSRDSMIASFCRIWASKYSRLLKGDRSVNISSGSEDEDEVEEFEAKEAEEEVLLRCDIFQGSEKLY